MCNFQPVHHPPFFVQHSSHGPSPCDSVVRSLRKLCAIAILALLGCKVGPNHSTPPTPPISPDFAAAYPAESDRYDDLVYWWSYLDDSALNSLVADACQQNLDLQESYYRIEASRARLRAVRADRLPQTDAVSQYAYRDFAENASQFISSTAGNRSFSFHSLGFDTSWEIDLFGKIARSIEAAQANLTADIESYRDIQVSLIAEVATTYVHFRLSQERLAIAERNLASQQETLRIVKERFASGLVSPLDDAQAESNVYRTAATIPDLRQLEQTMVNQLAFLIGRSPDVAFFERLGVGAVPTCPPNIATGVPADLLSRRPDVRQAERKVAQASAQIGVAVAEKYPQVSLLGTISVEARDVDMLFTSGSLANSVGPSFRWNILNFQQLNNIIDARYAEMHAAVTNYQRTVLSAVQEVEDGLVVYHRKSEREIVLQQAVAATARAVDSSQVRYEQGLIGFQPVLDSQRELLAVEDALATSRADRILGVVRVYKALGGGWQAESRYEVTSSEEATTSFTSTEVAGPSSIPEGELTPPSEDRAATEDRDVTNTQ